MPSAEWKLFLDSFLPLGSDEIGTQGALTPSPDLVPFLD